MFSQTAEDALIGSVESKKIPQDWKNTILKKKPSILTLKKMLF